MRFDEAQIDALRQKVADTMTDFRFTHTAEVEKMAVRLGELYGIEDIGLLRAAALLHDITKELDTQSQLELISKAGISPDEYDAKAHKTLHAVSAPYVIKRDHPHFACPELLDAVRYHTTGRAGMSLYECIIYLADYIDMSRKFKECVYLRNLFFDAHPENMSAEERKYHLYAVMLRSLDMTLESLEREGSPISKLSAEAREWLSGELEGDPSST